MEMTTDEIVRSFREAKDRRKQVTILAELNDCSVEEIRSTLVAGGISWRELPRAPRAGKAPNVATTEDPSESRKSPPKPRSLRKSAPRSRRRCRPSKKRLSPTVRCYARNLRRRMQNTAPEWLQCLQKYTVSSFCLSAWKEK